MLKRYHLGAQHYEKGWSVLFLATLDSGIMPGTDLLLGGQREGEGKRSFSGASKPDRANTGVRANHNANGPFSRSPVIYFSILLTVLKQYRSKLPQL